jgi:type VI secretion system protein ImpA
MDLQGLLASRGDDAPSGENLEYDMDFISLELAAQPGEEKQSGDAIIAAEDPDWTDVRDKALAVLERSHDLRAAAYLGQAILYLEGLTGFADVTGYVRGLLEDYWDTAHPQLDADDDDDPTARISASQNLAAPTTVMRAIRRASLTDSRTYGRVTLRDIQSASGEAPAEGAMDSSTIAAAFRDTSQDVLAARLAAAKKANDDIRAIDRVYADKLPGQGPDNSDLIRALRLIISTISEYVEGAPAGGDEAPAGAGDAGAGYAPAVGSGGGGGGGGGGVPGRISGLGDVTTALDNIIGFYARTEPSSPVPILLARAKRLVGADFLTIMKDMAPNGLDNVRLVGGLPDDD